MLLPVRLGARLTGVPGVCPGITGRRVGSAVPLPGVGSGGEAGEGALSSGKRRVDMPNCRRLSASFERFYSVTKGNAR